MKVQLKEITRDNWTECIRLKTTKIQEGFVASNMYSIAQSRFEPTWEPYGVYAGDQMVGFIMLGHDEPLLCCWIHRLMVDAQYQGKGYGKQALELAINHLKSVHKCRSICIGIRPSNVVAEHIYREAGFEYTGEDKMGELIMKLNM